MENNQTTLGGNSLAISTTEDDACIEKGATILGLYKIESDPIAGGMGRVFRVHHTGWNVDLAMKQPHGEMFQSVEQKDIFIHECEAWINLGLHPHIVSCYYVREIGGIPSIFAEWMNGGSLGNLIKSGALYEGDEQTVLKRILDISIQFVRGLHYAHLQKLIHQDVKPDNLLLDKDGAAKVADFGLANVKGILGVQNATADAFGGSVITESGGYTPRYASPEQINSREITRRTDIWSWAVSVLEMFVGDAPWYNGSVAGFACENYFEWEEAKLPVPESIKDLLRWCFKENEADRPHDFAIVEAELLSIYQSETGKPYPRPVSKAAGDTPDSLNNRALSFLDMDKPEKAEKCWEKAISLNPSHAECRYNQSIYLWQSAKIDDMEAIRLLVFNVANPDYYLGMLHLARADVESAMKCLTKAKETQGNTESIQKAIVIAEEMVKTGKDGRCLPPFKRYSKPGTYVCFNPDGSKALSGSRDKTMKLWDIASGECIRTFEGHTEPVDSVCFSPNGSFALSGSYDQTIKLWDTATGYCVRTIKGHTNIVSSICFSPNGSKVLSGSIDKTIKLWDIKIGACIRTFEELNGIYSVCFSPDGRFVFSGSYRSIKVWNISSGECVRTFEGHSDRVYSVCISPDGSKALSGSSDKTMKLWEVATGECLRTFEGHIYHISSVCFSPDGSKALSGSSDKTMKLWEVATGKCIRTFEGHTNSVESVCISPDGCKALSGDDHSDLMKLWQLPDCFHIEMLLNRIHSTAMAAKQEELFDALALEIDALIARQDISNALRKFDELRDVRLFGNGETYHSLRMKLTLLCITSKGILNWTIPLSINTERCYSHCISPDGSKVISGSKTGALFLWDITTGVNIRTIEGHTRDVTSVCFSPDSSKALSGSWDKTMKLWDIATGKCIRTFGGQTEVFFSVCVSPDGSKALSINDDGTIGYNSTIKLWEVATGKCIRTLDKGSATFACFSPDGKHVLSAHGYERRLKLWNVGTGECIRSLDKGSYDTVCFSPDGSKVLYSAAATVKLLDVATGEVICIFEGHTACVNSICFSPNGKLVLLGNGDNTMKLWNIANEECIHTFEGHTEAVISVCFTPDGTKIISASEDKILIHDLEFDLHFPGWADWDDWDEGAMPYLKIFLALHPKWTEMDFEKLITDLQHRGYGWLRPEGVKAKLEELTPKNSGFFSLFRKKNI